VSPSWSGLFLGCYLFGVAIHGVIDFRLHSIDVREKGREGILALQLRAVDGASGEMLQSLLMERGALGTPPTGVVSYGVKEEFLKTDPNLPTLNRNAGKYDKLQALERIRDVGVLVPYFSLDPEELVCPILGRKKKHERGKDIIPILAKDKTFEYLKTSGKCDFYVQFIPTAVEYRVWVYRRRHLATYEKYLGGPIESRNIYDFGFRYLDTPPEDLSAPASAAVQALELDFGAVDILRGQDGRAYVLEVNTAPWAQTRLRGLVRLADRIVRWQELGYPRRLENAQ
jgi:hypothetical protein